MRYRLIDTHKKTWPIRLMCKVLNVSPSGYYDWRKRTESAREQSNRNLDREIGEIYNEHRQRNGVPGVTEELKDVDSNVVRTGWHDVWQSWA